MSEINEYTINVTIQGYDLCMDVKVPAKDPDEAFDLACSKEFRYQEDDMYCLVAGKEPSVLCTYPTLEEALLHCETITSGEWSLVQKFGDEAIVIRSSSEDDDESLEES